MFHKILIASPWFQAMGSVATVTFECISLYFVVLHFTIKAQHFSRFHTQLSARVCTVAAATFY